MTDIELQALIVLVEGENTQTKADNEADLQSGRSPRWSGPVLPSNAEQALRRELERRGILSSD